MCRISVSSLHAIFQLLLRPNKAVTMNKETGSLRLSKLPKVIRSLKDESDLNPHILGAQASDSTP